MKDIKDMQDIIGSEETLGRSSEEEALHARIDALNLAVSNIRNSIDDMQRSIEYLHNEIHSVSRDLASYGSLA